MSDRRVAVALVLALVTGSALPAQQPGDTLVTRMAALQVRIDSLERARGVEESAEYWGDVGAKVRVGGMGLRTTPRLQPLATAAIVEAVTQARRLLGADIDSLAVHVDFTLREIRSSRRRAPLFFLAGSRAVPPERRTTSVALEGRLDGAGLTGITLAWPVASDELTSGILTLLDRAAAGRLSAPIEPWLDHRLPLREPAATFWTELYRQLATSDAGVTRRCAGGDREACRAAFDMDSRPTNPVIAWYDESDLPKLASTAGDQGLRSNLYRAFSSEEQEDCIVRNQLDPCRRMLALLAPEAFHIPMPYDARASLVRVALQIGGPDAGGRLRTSVSSTVAQQIGAASGVPADSVIGLWQQRLMESRPHSPLPDANFVLASLVVTAVCGAWATRGQPWK